MRVDMNGLLQERVTYAWTSTTGYGIAQVSCCVAGTYWFVGLLTIFPQ